MACQSLDFLLVGHDIENKFCGLVAAMFEKGAYLFEQCLLVVTVQALSQCFACAAEILRCDAKELVHSRVPAYGVRADVPLEETDARRPGCQTQPVPRFFLKLLFPDAAKRCRHAIKNALECVAHVCIPVRPVVDQQQEATTRKEKMSGRNAQSTLAGQRQDIALAAFRQ